MECLGIPVDHRLVKIIKDLDLPICTEASDHLETLKRWGELLHYDEERLKSSMIHHGVELAKPVTKGGVLVALLQPHSSQEFEQGFLTDLHDCATTDAVSDLIEAATGGRMSVDDVSVFDTLPYCPDGTNNSKVLEAARSAFQEMVEAKKPDVVLCCYQVSPFDTNNTIVKGLSSRGIGKVHNKLEFELSDGSTTKTINAFHPSYAVNYYPTYSCFRRLLLAEFVQAFSHWSGAGIKNDWIMELREKCARAVRALLKEEKEREKKSIYRPKIDEGQWGSILNDLKKSMATLGYFKRAIGVDKVVRSNLSWVCADASLFLSEVMRHEEEEPEAAGTIGASLIDDVLKPWCQGIYEHEPRNNEDLTDPRGFYESTTLLIAPELSRGGLLRDLHNHVSVFVLDLNLSFVYTGVQGYIWNAVEQRNAFKRLAVNLERTVLRYDNSLSDGMRSMGI